MQWVTWSCYPIKSNGERWLQITQDDDINNPTGNEQRKPPLRSLRPNQVLQMTDYEESRINALPFGHIYSKGVCIIQRVTGSSSHLFLLLARSSSHSYTTPPNIFAVSCKVTQQWVFITVWGADIGSSFDALTDSWLSILSGHKRSFVSNPSQRHKSTLLGKNDWKSTISTNGSFYRHGLTSNNRYADDMIRHWAHYDVIVMLWHDVILFVIGGIGGCFTTVSGATNNSKVCTMTSLSFQWSNMDRRLLKL